MAGGSARSASKPFTSLQVILRLRPSKAGLVGEGGFSSAGRHFIFALVVVKESGLRLAWWMGLIARKRIIELKTVSGEGVGVMATPT